MKDYTECITACGLCDHVEECKNYDEPTPRFGIYGGDEACVNDYIELKKKCCDGDIIRHGTIIKIFRDSNRAQRMVKFKTEDGFIDYCSLDEIDWLEPYSR
jgi:hypothetical protein